MGFGPTEQTHIHKNRSRINSRLNPRINSRLNPWSNYCYSGPLKYNITDW